MKLKVSNDIEIYDAPESLKEELDVALTLDNPDYIKAMTRNIGRRNGEGIDVWDKRTKSYTHVTKTISLYWKDGDIIHVPAGCLSGILRSYPECDVEIDRPEHLKIWSGNLPISGRQSEAVSECVRVLDAPFIQSGGILTGPCGSGKTWMGLSVASAIGIKTLWICHTIILAEQARKQAIEHFGSDGMTLMVGGKLRIGERMTFATVQTLNAMDLARFRDVWGLAIVDECHHCVGCETNITMYSHVMNSLNCIKFGLTATADRTDGMMDSAFAIIGPVIHALEHADMPERYCDIERIRVEAHPQIDVKKCLTKTGTIDPHMLMMELISDMDRYKILCDIVRDCPKPCMVLSSRLELLYMLMGTYRDAVMVKKDRTTDADITLATYQLASEGYDRKELRSVIFATPESNEIRITQTAGRVQRSCEGKEKGIIYDIVDICDYFKFKDMAKKRDKCIKRLALEIERGKEAITRIDKS